MDMQTGKNEAGVPAQNFGVLALQRQVFARSNITGIFINKQTFDYEAAIDDHEDLTRYNRNLGFEYNLASSNNIWRGKLLYLRSFTGGAEGNDQVIAGNLGYNSKHWSIGMQYDYIGSNYNAEVGFVPRTGLHRLNPEAGYLFFPKSGPVLSHGPFAQTELFYDTDYRPTDNETFLLYRFNFQDRSEFNAWVAHNYVKLLDPFDPTNLVGDTLATGTEHRWNAWGLEYVSKPQSRLTYALATRYGGYYANGKRLRLNGELGYRFQPYVAITMSATYNHLKFFDDEMLPESMQGQSYDLWLVGPRIDVTLTNRLFLTNFLQYNNQEDNINLNIRLQWRYRPASDLFLVYTDNYYAEGLGVKNRALVLKLTYWWNV
jgi:hypothetical protein